MLRKRGLRPETVEALRARLGGNDGAQVTIDPETGRITIEDGEINLELSIPEIMAKRLDQQPPQTKS
jgi:hypothetical protein